MNYWISLGAMVLVQVTVITIVTAMLMALVHRKMAIKYSIGVSGLALVFLSPIYSGILPPTTLLIFISDDSVAQSRTIETQPLLSTVPLRQSKIGDTTRIDNDLVGASNVNRFPLGAASTISVASSPTTSRNSAETPFGLSIWQMRLLATIGIIWGIGIAYLTWRFLLTRRQINRLRLSLRPTIINERIKRQVRSALELRRLPTIAASDLAPMPLVLGVLKPTVVIPENLIDASTDARLRDVLIHECAHIVRCDPWIHFIQQLLGIVYWPHPGVHWLNREISRSREEVCDNYVIQQNDSTEYAQTLLELAEQYSHPRFALSLLGFFQHRWTLEQRVQDLLNTGRDMVTRTKRWPVLLAILFLSGICLLVGGIKFPEQAMAQQSPVIEDKPAIAIKPKMRSITIAGTCSDDRSSVLSGARIQIFRYPSLVDPPELVAETVSDIRGRFEVREVETAVDRSAHNGMSDLVIGVAASSHASVIRRLQDAGDRVELSLRLSSNPGRLSGRVTDEQGRPVKDVKVYFPHGNEMHPVPGIMSAVTNALGRFQIYDLNRWSPEETKRQMGGGVFEMQVERPFLVERANYGRQVALNTGIPQDLELVLHLPAIVEGTVIDDESSKPIPNAIVSAQGVVQGGGHARTDTSGRYRLMLQNGRYNIWAETDDRIPIAVNALAAEPGKTVSQADVHMVKGAFVYGKYLDSNTSAPVINGSNVAHYGPARPRTGAAVLSTDIKDDGSYRLRVAPGRNFIYTMDGSSSAYIDVKDGEELQLDLYSGKRVPSEIERRDPDFLLGVKIREDMELERKSNAQKAASTIVTVRDGETIPTGGVKRFREGRTERGIPFLSKIPYIGRLFIVVGPKPERRDSPTGRLLNKLEAQNVSPERYTDPWLHTLKEISDQGASAVPELIAELDATSDERMMRCLGFMLRAIGDKRAVPALIRAIPKTLIPPSNDYETVSDDPILLEFAQVNDLGDKPSERGPNRYLFKRPFREIIGALHFLTGHEENDMELNFLLLDGTASEIVKKREHYYAKARAWADWWETNAASYVNDPVYYKVNLVR